MGKEEPTTGSLSSICTVRLTDATGTLDIKQCQAVDLLDVSMSAVQGTDSALLHTPFGQIEKHGCGTAAVYEQRGTVWNSGSVTVWNCCMARMNRRQWKHITISKAIVPSEIVRDAKQPRHQRRQKPGHVLNVAQ